MCRIALTCSLIVAINLCGCASHRGDLSSPVEYAAEGVKERSNRLALKLADWGDDHPIVRGTVTCVVIVALVAVCCALVILAYGSGGPIHDGL